MVRLNENSEEEFKKTFNDAIKSASITANNSTRFTKSKGHIRELKHVGFSYAKKYVRFLFPNEAVVLDSQISEGLGWDLNTTDYGG